MNFDACLSCRSGYASRLRIFARRVSAFEIVIRFGLCVLGAIAPVKCCSECVVSLTLCGCAFKLTLSRRRICDQLLCERPTPVFHATWRVCGCSLLVALLRLYFESDAFTQEHLRLAVVQTHNACVLCNLVLRCAVARYWLRYCACALPSEPLSLRFCARNLVLAVLG